MKMEINFGPVFDMFSKVVKTASNEIFHYIPMELSTSKKFANAYAACIAVLVTADRKIEVDETQAAINFIKQSNEIKNIDCVSETLGYYINFIKQIAEDIDNEPMVMVKIAKIIEENIKIVEKQHHKQLLIQLVCNLVGNTANAAETKAKNELLSALS